MGGRCSAGGGDDCGDDSGSVIDTGIVVEIGTGIGARWNVGDAIGEGAG